VVGRDIIFISPIRKTCTVYIQILSCNYHIHSYYYFFKNFVYLHLASYTQISTFKVLQDTTFIHIWNMDLQLKTRTIQA